MSSERAFRHHTLSESSGGSGVSEMLRPVDPYPEAATASATPGQQRPRPQLCESVYLVPTRLATVLLALLQGGVLDCYLTHYNSTYWFAWIAGDVAVLMMFVVAFVISFRQMSQIMRRLLSGAAVAQPGPGSARGGSMSRAGELSILGGDLGADKEEGGCLVMSPGSMPLVYFAWLVYSSVLAIRVLLIYKNFAHELNEDAFLDTNMLQMTVAISSMVFLLLLFAHHDAANDSRRRQRIDNLTYLVPFDLVDGADLLRVLSNPVARDSMEDWVTWTVLGVACFNLILPTLPLMALSRTRFGARRLPEFLQTLQRLLVLLGVNMPLLATRLLLWQHLQLPVSTFMVKNMVVSFLVLYSFYERDHHKRLRDRLTEGQELVS